MTTTTTPAPTTAPTTTPPGLKVRGDAKELAKAVRIAAAAKSPRPLLRNLLLDAHDGVLEVIGTDIDVTIRVRVERADVMSDGRVLVNAARFQEILRELKGEQVEIEADERAGCIVSAGNSRFRVMGDEPDHFPDVSSWKGEVAFRLPAPELAAMIRRTEFAAHTDEHRYALNGILIDLKYTRLRLVATDSARLAMCERPAPEVKTSVFVIVPTKAMRHLARTIAGDDGNVEVSVEPERIQFRTASATITARLVEGSFPPYEDVLPKEDYDKKILMPREGFLSALRLVAPRARARARRPGAVQFDFTRDGLELTAPDGESHAQLPIDYPYDEMTIGFNPAFFSDALKELTSAEFRLQLKDTNSPAVIQEQDEDGGSFVYLVMPRNLGA